MHATASSLRRSRARAPGSHIIKTPSTRSLLTMPIAVPASWTPEQAIAVVELLDDLRELIWDHYGPQLLDEIREDQMPRYSDQSGSPPDDPPF